MTPDLKRLCDKAYAACEDRALLADRSDAEAIVRSILTELREPSQTYRSDSTINTGQAISLVAMINEMLAEPTTT